MNLKRLFFLILILKLSPVLGSEKKPIEKFNSSHLILEHIGDSHFWHLWGEGENAFSIALPVILWDKGFVFFSSNEFGHGERLVKKKKSYYKLFKDKIYFTNDLGEIKKDSSGRILNSKPIDLSLTKNVVASFLCFFLLIGIFMSMKNSYKEGRSTSLVGKLIEPILVFIRDEVAIKNLGQKNYPIYLPFLLSVFFFILFGNLLGLLPGGPNITGNISVTFVLAAFIFLMVLFRAKKNYWKHIFWMPGVPLFVRFLLIPIELAGFFIKPMTLCIRLFANIAAGHIIILSFICIIFIFKNIFAAGFSIPFALFISILEILVAFLQAFIFTTLSALFIGTAIEGSSETH